MKQRQERVQMVHVSLSKRSRAKLLGINLSSCYMKPKPIGEDTVTLMNEIRDLYALRPFQGYRRMTLDLKDLGYEINHKKVYRLMKVMGLQAIYPKKSLSHRHPQHKVYPYLLKANPALKPHDVWCVDITYIKIAVGFVYLTALIDVVSRYVVGFSVSTSLDTESCLQALEMAVEQGYKPKIINSDQGSQFTAQEWVYQLSLLGVKISMDGKGRALDNISIERFWRTVKYEEVYLKAYETVEEAKINLAAYIHWYNHKRRHSGIENYRPYEVLTNEEISRKWLFPKADGYVDNAYAFSHIPTASTTIKQKKVKLITYHSSAFAA